MSETGFAMSADHHPLEGLWDLLQEGQASIAVVGLGYVGMPLARCFARRYPVVGYDRDADYVASLQKETFDGDLRVTADEKELSKCRVFFVCVPTPVDDKLEPDLRALLGATEYVGRNMPPGSLVVYESTVFPGCTRNTCVPVLEKTSGFQMGTDFVVGYSPERINPGDREHALETVAKVVSAVDADSLAFLGELYGSVLRAAVQRTETLEVAESAKMLENTQRDINIALINEFARYFHTMGIDTREVLQAAGSKWNFHAYQPGLVGGHCIGVDPYYLLHAAAKDGHDLPLVGTARKVNESMVAWIANECRRLLGADGEGKKVLVLGVGYKPDSGDPNHSRCVNLVAELEARGMV
ncbi:MAG: nucleotide sugar dehydrogenase, partial [Gemmatimonadetes bacterium]|nr:nucleotide sugar dehydrogenase [Gemmatimonadota bacterium]